MDTHACSYVYDGIGNRLTATNNGVGAAYLTKPLNQYTNIFVACRQWSMGGLGLRAFGQPVKSVSKKSAWRALAMKTSPFSISKKHLLYACMLLTMLAGACANSDPHLMTGDSPDCMQYAIGNTKETGVSSGTGKATIVNSGRNMEWPAFYFERHRRFIADVRSEYGLTNFIIGGRANWISSANQGSSNAVGIVEVTFITNTIPLIVDVTLRFQFNEGGMHRSIPLSDQIEVISMLVSDITFKFKELIAPTDGFQVWPGGVFFSIEAPTVAREHIDMFEWRKVEELAYLRKMLEEIWTSKINVGE